MVLGFVMDLVAADFDVGLGTGELVFLGFVERDADEGAVAFLGMVEIQSGRDT